MLDSSSWLCLEWLQQIALQLLEARTEQKSQSCKSRTKQGMRGCTNKKIPGALGKRGSLMKGKSEVRRHSYYQRSKLVCG